MIYLEILIWRILWWYLKLVFMKYKIYGNCYCKIGGSCIDFGRVSFIENYY